MVKETETEKSKFESLPRRLRHLMRSTPVFFTRETAFSPWFNHKKAADVREIYTIAESLKMSDSELEALWTQLRSLQQSLTAKYSVKPLRERKDNRNPETYGVNFGSGISGSRNRVRVPSKKRKTAWKNFLKMFPQFSSHPNNPFK